MPPVNCISQPGLMPSLQPPQSGECVDFLLGPHRGLGGDVCSVTQSCPTLCDHMDCSLPGSSVHSSPKKGNAKECSNDCTIALISHASQVMLALEAGGGCRQGRGDGRDLDKHSMDSSKEDSGRTRAPPGGALTAQPAWIPARRILGGHGPLLGVGRDSGNLVHPFMRVTN